MTASPPILTGPDPEKKGHRIATMFPATPVPVIPAITAPFIAAVTVHGFWGICRILLQVAGSGLLSDGPDARAGIQGPIE